MTDPLQPPTVNGVPIAHGPGVTLFRDPLMAATLPNWMGKVKDDGMDVYRAEIARLTAELDLATRQREEMAAALQAVDDAFTGEGGRRLYTACTAFDAHKVIAAALANNKATT